MGVDTMSVGSRGSMGSKAGSGHGSASSSRRYRTISRGSEVDQSLFGAPRSTIGGAGRAIIDGNSLPASATVVSAKELEQIRSRSTKRSPQIEEAERALKELQNEEKQRAARLRKEKMIEREEEAKLKAKKSDIECEKLAREMLILKLANEKLDENNDMVKMLNSLGARAAAFTIRDQQIAEKERGHAKEAEYETRMDMLMELDRLRDLQRREEEEKKKVIKRHEDRKVIVEQIEERRKQKLFQLEAREQENQAMLATIQKYTEEEQAIKEKKAVELRKARLEVLKANESAIKAREAHKIREQEEIEAILAYQAMKDQEMGLREAAEADKQRLMKERQQKLLDGQARDMGKRAELDELRSRRAAEEKERRERLREREEAEKRRKELHQLDLDRKKQAEMKRAKNQRDAELEQQEYESALRYNAEMTAREHKEAEAKKKAAMEHREAILAQIAEIERKRKEDRAEKFEEGRRLKAESERESLKLQLMRDQMCQDMEKKGMNPKYLSEMKNVDIMKLLQR
ncbi:unnamed protein product [Chrysoparadoxa australica]